MMALCDLCDPEVLYQPLCPQNLASSEGHLPALLFLGALAALAREDIPLPQGPLQCQSEESCLDVPRVSRTACWDVAARAPGVRPLLPHT